MQPTRGIVAASGAYMIWGLLPVYWKTLKALPAYEILCHRMAWSLVFMIILLIVTGRFRRLIPLFKDAGALMTFATTSMLLAVNWLIYIWSVNSGYIIEASLGYYINPLVTVAFGVVFLKERLRFGQVSALVLAFCGVGYLTFIYGSFPWIALSLALTFAVYGLLHKKTTTPPIEGLCLETIIFFLPAAGFLIWLELQGNGAFIHSGGGMSLLMVGTGLITTVPLLLFAFAAHNLPLSLLGVLQYMAPTLNLLLGVFLYREEFPTTRLIGFLLVWCGLLVFVLEGTLYRARHRRAPLSKPLSKEKCRI